jgi:hypothetical protein
VSLWAALDYVDLDRRFRDLKSDAPEVSELLALVGHDQMGSLNWATLLKSKRVLILAQAGSGKTRELQAAAARLRAEGKAAFFLPLELLQTDDVASVLAAEPDLAELFRRWRNDSEAPAWFMLDAVDELKLAHGRLDTALRRLAASIGPARPRARLLVSSRPSDWQAISDLETLNAWFPPSLPTAATPVIVAEDEFTKHIFRRRGKDEEEAPRDDGPEFRAVELMDLDRNQIERFATAAGVSNVSAFLAEIDKHDAWIFAGRPLDLDDLIGVWLDDGRLGSRLEQHDSAVRRGLQERPDRQDAHLSPDRARDGARRLALTLVLTGKRTIRAPERAFGQRADASALDASAVLPGWSDAEVGSLLRRSLFDPATYGRVRFHHRTIQEFLAAERLHDLRARGMTQRQLQRFLFAERYGERVVIPTRRSLAAWFALRNDIVAKEVLAREPEVLILHGDPQSLSLDARAELVRRYLAAYGKGDWRNLQLPVTEVRRLAKADLAPVIRECWNAPHSNGEVDVLLLKLIWLGAIEECADIALRVAMEHARSNIARILAIRALAACGKTSDLRRVGDDMLTNSGSWPESAIYHAIGDLFPSVLTVDEVGQLIRDTPEPKDTIDGFGWALYQLAGQLDVSSVGDDLRTLLTDMIWRGRSDPLEWHRLQSTFGYLCPALLKVCLRQLEAGLPLSHERLRSCVIANRFHEHESLGSKESSALQARVRDGTRELRARMLDAEFAFVQDLGTEIAAQARFYLGHEGLFHLRDEDWPWLLEALAAPGNSARGVVLDMLTGAWWRRGRQANEMAQLQQAIIDDPNLGVILERETTPRPPSRAMVGHDAIMAEIRARHEAEEAENEKSWQEFKRELETNTDFMFGAKNGSNTLLTLVRWLGFRKQRGASIAQANWRDVGAVVGSEIGKRFEAGLREFWRDEAPPVRSTRPPEERNGISARQTMALTGLLIEAAQGDHWPEALDAKEALRAAQWATLELTGFPEWLTQLAGEHPDATRTALRSELAFEAQHFSTERHPHVLNAIAHASDNIKRLALPELRPLALNWDGGPNDATAGGPLAQLLSIITQLDRADVALTDEYERRFRLDPEQGSVWLQALAACDLPRAVQVMRSALADLSEDRSRTCGIAWIGALFDPDRHTRISVPLDADAALLLELTRIAYELVRREDDVHHIGIYTPDERDDAERARNRILSVLVELPGVDAYDGLLKLAEQPLFAHISDRLRQQAHERAAADSEPEPTTVANVAAIDARLETPPQTRDALFETMQARLDDIDFDLQNHDFDERPALRLIENESAMQPLLARKLQDAARGAYVVSREEEVAERKETDVRLAATEFNGRAVIEIKLGDNWSVNQLEEAISTQLLEKYLRHPDCSAGCLLVTYAGRKGFKNPDDGKPMQFPAVIERLNARAQLLEQAEEGRVRICAIGLDLR